MSVSVSRAWVRTVSLVGLGLMIATHASAQTQQRRTTGTVRVVPGFAYERATFGDDSPKPNAGGHATIGVQIGSSETGTTAWIFEATLQLGSLDNPHPIGETLSELYLLTGPRLGRRSYVRLGGGVAVQSWFGFFSPSGLALAGGAAAGHELRRGRFRVSPEIVVRTSLAIGIFTRWVGVQVPLSW